MSSSSSSSSSTQDNAAPALQKRLTAQLQRQATQTLDDLESSDPETMISGAFRGIAAALRKFVMAGKKLIAAKGPALKQGIRTIGETRPLAFASEGAVAGESILPRVAYYGAWSLSGAAICADIYNKQDDAPEHLKTNTVIYWTTFHLPASLVVPALMIHQIVHAVEHAVQNPKGMAKSWSPRIKTAAPVAAALLSIIPIVPVVDAAAEAIMEPTLGAYLGLEFEHHHGHGHDGSSSSKDPATLSKEETKPVTDDKKND